MDEVPLIYEIVEGLLRKGETVLVDLHHRYFRHIGGVLTKLELIGTLSPPLDILGQMVLVHHDSFTSDITPTPVALSLSNLENNSNLQRVDVGWLLTISHEKPT